MFFTDHASFKQSEACLHNKKRLVAIATHAILSLSCKLFLSVEKLRDENSRTPKINTFLQDYLFLSDLGLFKTSLNSGFNNSSLSNFYEPKQ